MTNDYLRHGDLVGLALSEHEEPHSTWYIIDQEKEYSRVYQLSSVKSIDKLFLKEDQKIWLIFLGRTCNC